MKKILIVGANSYLSNGLDKYLLNFDIKKIHHSEVNRYTDFRDFDFIINFSISPDFFQHEIDVCNSLDSIIIKNIKNSDSTYIFLSSRQVYGKSDSLKFYNEDSPLKKTNFYSINKILLEEYIKKNLGYNYTILRIPNIIGELTSKNDYKTFIGWISNSLKYNKIINLTINEFTAKDFISKKYFHESLCNVINYSLRGIYNISSGYGSTIKFILENYVGCDKLIFNKNSMIHDQFVLDNSQYLRITNHYFGQVNLYNDLKYYNSLI